MSHNKVTAIISSDNFNLNFTSKCSRCKIKFAWYRLTTGIKQATLSVLLTVAKTWNVLPNHTREQRAQCLRRFGTNIWKLYIFTNRKNLTCAAMRTGQRHSPSYARVWHREFHFYKLYVYSRLSSNHFGPGSLNQTVYLFGRFLQGNLVILTQCLGLNFYMN